MHFCSASYSTVCAELQVETGHIRHIVAGCMVPSGVKHTPQRGMVGMSLTVPRRQVARDSVRNSSHSRRVVGVWAAAAVPYGCGLVDRGEVMSYELACVL